MNSKKFLRILLGTLLIILGIIMIIIGTSDVIESTTGNNFVRNFLSINRSTYMNFKTFIYIGTGILLFLNVIFNRRKR